MVYPEKIQCKKCGEFKTHEEYYWKRGGYLSDKKCKVCCKEYSKEYRNSPEYKERSKEYENSSKRKEYHKEFLKEYWKSFEYKEYCKKRRNSPKLKEYRKEYYSSSKFIKWCKEYRDKLPDPIVWNHLKKQFNLDRETIKKYPELIEAKRMSIKLKRQIKTKKDETS